MAHPASWPAEAGQQPLKSTASWPCVQAAGNMQQIGSRGEGPLWTWGLHLALFVAGAAATPGKRLFAQPSSPQCMSPCPELVGDR